MIFHLGDTYFFINELVKTQGTSPEEAALYTNYMANRKRKDSKYGKIAVGCVCLPYFYACFSYGGMAWKFISFYFVLNTMNATYDCGMYANFLINGPTFIKKLLALDPKDSFSPI